MIWNSKKSVLLHRGRKSYGFGDKLPANVIAEMGTQSVAEYIEKGMIIRGEPIKIIEPAAVLEKDVLIEKAKSLGLSPHYKAGIPKLKAMIADHEDLQALKEEALSLEIVVRDDVTFEELTLLVSNKKADLGLSDPNDDEPDH